MAPGTILENMSSRKLVVFCTALLIVQICSFLLGGLVAPRPTNSMMIIGTKCYVGGSAERDSNDTQQWFSPPQSKAPSPCHSFATFEDANKAKYHTNDILLSFHIPHKSLGGLSRYFQFLVLVLNVDSVYDPKYNYDNDAVMTLDTRIAYMNKGDQEWKPFAASKEQRKLECAFDYPKIPEYEDYRLDCNYIPLMEMGAVYHDFYLLNIRLPVDQGQNQNLGRIKDLSLVFIHQNGGFTKVWFSMKTALFPVSVLFLVWYWKRVNQENRKTHLLEKAVLVLGASLVILDVPLEWFTLVANLPFMLLLSDIRQGAFYLTLFSFWIVFTGEHSMAHEKRNNLRSYWKELSCIVLSCVILLVFDMCERGIQLSNPFYSIWASKSGSRVAKAFIVIGGISACAYFFLLLYMVFKVLRNIHSKKMSISYMNMSRKMQYEGIVYRFRFLMLFTLLCSAVTVIFFIITHVTDMQDSLGETEHVEKESAFLTGVYGLWNVYVIAILFLYAPSHKELPNDRQLTASLAHGDSGSQAVSCISRSLEEDEEEEIVELEIGQTDHPSIMYHMTGKQSID